MPARPPETAVPAEPAGLRERLGELTLRDEHRLERRVEKALRHPEDERGLAKLLQQIEEGARLVDKRRRAVPEITYPEQLPVAARRDELLSTIRDNQVVVVAGETGSGKTTQLPKICLELGRGVRGLIGHTQPRRLAARTVAERIADELDVQLGAAVGYAVRFSDRTRDDTLIRLMTDGLLLAEIQHDRLLRRYDTIIVDEAHERSLNIDFLLGYLHRILPKRPDLKLIITSATIETARFSEHFFDAPVVEVSGRTFPVEVRYRPTVDPDDPEGEERDQIEAIGDAVEELATESDPTHPGDVLVFLSGEREIRDTAEALTGRFRDQLEILPLYARLATADQQKIFRRGKGGRRRVVLATNVAETSLTVPGIKYVVDPGFARISRYSARLKVQRLPIERVSQASANQRKGRSGRTSPGIAIRLYSEEDFDARPEFTDPEILRTSLAAVILQMASLGLGEIEEFPFLDPPDKRQVRDGINLLSELGAIDAQRGLTPLGRRLARLPVDPRMGRMVLEADRLGCADEVITIAAALSIQDPRERPAEKAAQADQLHARFKDETSDFLAYLNLWRHLRERQKELNKSQFRKETKAEFLHFMRIREWQDLAAQLRTSAKAAGVTINQLPAEPPFIHQALLAGLLSHVGLRDAAKRDYLGARGARFTIFPGSALARKQPTWVMVAELVETSRLFGRTAAKIDPAWVEPLAQHLVSRSYSEPRWEAKRGSVIASERVTLYGLPIVAGRKIQFGKIDPEVSRSLFLRKALVENDWQTKHHFVRDNAKLMDEVRELEDVARRRDLLVDDQTLYDFFAARVPEGIVDQRGFDRWWRDARQATPDLLTFTPELLLRSDVDVGGRPGTWKQGGLELQLSYRFEPGAENDGVTVHVPLRALGQVQPKGFDWLVPALRPELVTALIRALPKELRRPLVPVPQVVSEVVARLRPRKGPIFDQIAALLGELRGVRVVPHEVWDVEKLPPHLRMTFRVEDERGRVLAEGKSLEALQAQLRPRLRAELTAATSSLERTGLKDWPSGLTIPKAVALPDTGQAIRAYPSLVDEGGKSVGVRVHDTPGVQSVAMRAGTRRLLLLTCPAPLKWVQSKLTTAEGLALAVAPHGSVGAALEDCMVAAVDALTAEAGGPAWDEPAWRRLRDHVAGHLAERTLAVARDTARVLDAERDVRRRLEGMTAEPLRPAVSDVMTQLRRLVSPGFVARTGAARLRDVERYLHAADRRLERLPSAPAPDLDRMRAIQELEQAYHHLLDTWPPGKPLAPQLLDVRWLLEELRVSHFAQTLGVKGQVSAKRIRKLLDEAAAAAR
ncbi:MAG TPA: ATP-dependent RNA helicase HrpA [Solirubrobacteraceae bacterium]|nr:ATP-dependent RNA helicase HrpA [Solirubrobacteraceae bacterium]